MVSKLKETIRDKSRDNLANTLITLGIKAEMAERGMEQKKLGMNGTREDKALLTYRITRSNG